MLVKQRCFLTTTSCCTAECISGLAGDSKVTLGPTRRVKLSFFPLDVPSIQEIGSLSY